VNRYIAAGENGDSPQSDGSENWKSPNAVKARGAQGPNQHASFAAQLRDFGVSGAAYDQR
jgi:hypothetical protein